MPLFVCDMCKAIENTALGYYWSRGMDFGSGLRDSRALCSDCMEGTEFSPKGWHNQFPKIIATTEIIKEMGEEHFVYVADIPGVNANNACVGGTYPDRNAPHVIQPKIGLRRLTCTCGNNFKAKKTSICKKCNKEVKYD